MLPTDMVSCVLIIRPKIILFTKSLIFYSAPPSSPLSFRSISRMFSTAKQFGTAICRDTIVDIYSWRLWRSLMGAVSAALCRIACCANAEEQMGTLSRSIRFNPNIAVLNNLYMIYK